MSIQQQEYTLRALGLPATMLRNDYYQELFVNESLQSFVDSGVIVTNPEEGNINTVERNDLALAIATVLAEEGHENKVYELASPPTWNDDKLANMRSDVSEKTVIHQTESDAEVLEGMVKEGASEESAHYQVAFYNSIASANNGKSSDDLEKRIGRKPVSIRESVTDCFNKTFTIRE